MQQLQEAANRQRALLLMSRIYIGSINFELGEEAVSLGTAHKGLNEFIKQEVNVTEYCTCVRLFGR